MNKAIACCGLIAALLFGEAQARSVNPKHLDPVTPAIQYNLGKDVPVEGYNITFTLKAGTYLLKYRDSRGSYLVGDGECMHLDIHTPKLTGTNDWTCGIYVPNDASRGASFYRIRPSSNDDPGGGAIVNAIIRYGYGSFDWPDKAESLELRNSLSVAAP